MNEQAICEYRNLAHTVTRAARRGADVLAYEENKRNAGGRPAYGISTGLKSGELRA
jgi:hypothetical protein